MAKKKPSGTVDCEPSYVDWEKVARDAMEDPMTPSQDLTEWLAVGVFVSLFYTVLFAAGLLTWLMLGVLS